MKQRMAFVSLATVVFVLSPLVAAQRERMVITDQQLNTLVAQEATQNIVTFLAESGTATLATQQGAPSVTTHPAPLSGTWSGNATSNGWSLSFVGHINGLPAEIREIGVLTKNVASWEDFGTVGSRNVTGSGTAKVSSNNKINWDQSAEEEEDLVEASLQDEAKLRLKKWHVIVAQIILCISSPQFCNVIVLVSELLTIAPGKGPGTVISQLNPTTGTVFGSNVRQASPPFATLQEGSISFDTGKISYVSDSFTPQLP